MTALKVLFIGGSGEISSACSALTVERGNELAVLNRGRTPLRPLPREVRVLKADIRDSAASRAAIGAQEFDVVVDFVAFTPAHVQADLELFRGHVGQYVFISSASAYQTPVRRLPLIESTPLGNPAWPYSQAKIACEELLARAYREDGFPATIVRPSHTYDRTQVPYDTGWTAIERMRRGKPIVVHGDGTSLWTLTHSTDFAKGFVALLGNAQAIGDSFHITSDEVLTWNQIHEILAAAAGAEPPRIVHVPSDTILAHDETWGRSLLGDKAHSLIFDNTKIRQLAPDYVATVPFSQGAREIIAWYDQDPSRRKIDRRIDDLIDHLVDRFHVRSPTPALGRQRSRPT
jgi:nucleoside-diphosphate-sugar epimerase